MTNVPAQPATALMNRQEIAKQVEVELALLMHIEQALRIALDWRATGHENTRKLSTIRFVTRTFERHLTRMRILSAHGGYMHLITELKPHLASAVQGLKQLRDELQEHLERMMLRLEHVSPDEAGAFDELCTELENYLQELAAHGRSEVELWQHAFAQEEGGSG